MSPDCNGLFQNITKGNDLTDDSEVQYKQRSTCKKKHGCKKTGMFRSCKSVTLEFNLLNSQAFTVKKLQIKQRLFFYFNISCLF